MSGIKVGIAGIGGIGSNVARHLAQAGIGQVKLVDFDRVEAANLNRQFFRADQVGRPKTRSLKENLLSIFPDMRVETIDCRMGPGDAPLIFRDCRVVVEGFDDRRLKKMIVEELAGTEKIVVSASGIAGFGLDGVGIRRLGNCHVVGDFQSCQDSCALFPPKIAMVAALMADIVLKGIMEWEN